MIGRTALPRAASVVSTTILPNAQQPVSPAVKVAKSLKVYTPFQKTQLPTRQCVAMTNVTGVQQVRYSHTDVKVPSFDDYRRDLNKDPKATNKSQTPARLFNYVTTGAVTTGAVYLGKNVFQDIVSVLSITKQDIALAQAEISLDAVPEGKSMMFSWKGKPIFVRHRTPEDIERERNVNLAELRDPQHDDDRVRNPEWLVVVAICTHLGCVPEMDAGHFSGYYCPCHGSHYDASGRIRQGPAPLNLEVPYHEFPEEKTVLIGLPIEA